MKNFLSGLITALILGILFNTIFGYIKFGYFQNPEKFLGLLKNQNERNQPSNQIADKDVKSCKDLVTGASAFGNLKVTITGNGKPIGDLEVDLSSHPGPIRCMQKTDKNGTVSFETVPTGQMFIFFNENAYPKQFGHPPTEQVMILQGQLVEKTLELKNQ
ncbi:MAG: hypothetical protein M1142_03435 [Patescibacteria group bacterium]|nr:hypothetical protein [Patescibacteria group bacterium]